MTIIEQLIQTFNETHNTNVTSWNEIPDRFKEELSERIPEYDEHPQYSDEYSIDLELGEDIPY